MHWRIPFGEDVASDVSFRYQPGEIPLQPPPVLPLSPIPDSRLPEAMAGCLIYGHARTLHEDIFETGNLA